MFDEVYKKISSFMESNKYTMQICFMMNLMYLFGNINICIPLYELDKT